MNRINYIFEKILAFICLISVAGAVIYRLYALNNIGVAIILILAIAGLLIILFLEKKYSNSIITADKNKSFSDIFSKFNLINSIFPALYLLAVAGAFYILFQSRTTSAIISPWETIPPSFFFVCALATLLLVINIIKNKRIALALIMIHYFLSFSVAWIVYQLGYGFDAIIHQATIDLIDKAGLVEPKPLYYLGQYSLLIVLHKIFFIPLPWLNKLLVPVLASIFLPFIIYHAASRWLNDKTKIKLVILFLLVIPFSIFIVTTPQNLGYFFLLLAIFLGVSCKNISDLIFIFLLSLAALANQPIAGIPAFMLFLALAVYYSELKIKKYFYYLIFSIAAVSLPLAFFLLEKINKAAAGQTLPASDSRPASSAWLSLNIPDQENFILNFIYLYAFNINIIIALFIFSGIIIALHHKKECHILAIYFSLFLSLIFSYWLVKFISFDFLISYERADYADRILLTAVLFLLPFIFLAFYKFISKLSRQNKIIKTAFLLLGLSLITTSLYLSYPRYDRYFNSRGYSVGQNDIMAVRWINADANEDYIVLANQQVSAAALSQFGFKKYYKNNIFYYPIPTSSPLYQYYLDMVYKKPDKKTMGEAMDLAGVKVGYFVLNKYWWAFPKILDEAKLHADSWQELGNGEVFVFKYKSPPLKIKQ